MLTRSSVLAAHDAAKRITQDNVNLRPKAGTLLDELQVSTATMLNTNTIDDMTSALSYLTPEVYSAKTEYIASGHDTVMDAYVTDISQLIASHVSFIKGVVNPQVSAFKDDLIQTYNAVKISTPEEAFNVSYFKPHEIFFTEALNSELNTGSISSAATFNSVDKLNITKVDPIEYPVNKYLLVGDEQYDGMILAWIKSIGEQLVTSYIYSDIDLSAIDICMDMNYSLANYLFYRNLTERLDIDFGLTTLQLRNKAVVLRNEYLRRTKDSIELYKMFMRKGDLLLSSSDVRFREVKTDEYLNITIFQDSYDAFVEKGGSLEAILGYIATANSYDITVPTLLDQQANYLDRWNSVRTLFIIRSNNAKLERFKTAINLTYDKTNATLADGEEEARKGQQLYTEAVNKALNAYLKTIQTSNIDDLDTVAITVIAGIRFYYTNAFSFLTDMNNIMKMSDKIPVDEAALFAVINYISEFMLGQAYQLK